MLLLAGSAGVLAGSVGFRWWLVVPGVALVVAVAWWGCPRGAAFGGWLAVALAAVGAASAPDGRWARFVLLGGFALVGAALGYLAGDAVEPVRRALWSGGLAVALVVGVLLPGPGISVTGTPDADAQAAGLSSEQVDALDDYIRAQLDALRLPGAAVAVVHGDEPALVRGYGVAGPDRRPIAPDTPFVMASLSKGFTALAVLQVAEAGDVDLDRPVREYLPWFETRNQEEADAITVRHLLNQTSGFTTPQGWNLIERSRQHTIEDDVRAAADHALHDPPGTSYEYSNVNFQIAGAIIEAVTGRSYEEYMESEVFGPLGMVSTSAGDEDAHASGLADGYRDWWGLPFPTGTTVIEGAVPMGGISSSAHDMANYLVAQLNGGEFDDNRVASESVVSSLHEDVVPTDPDDDDPTDFYGFGWNRSLDEEDGTVTLGHDGVAPGFSSGMRIRPGGEGDTGWGVVALVNRQSAVAQPGPEIADGVFDIVTGEDLHPTVGGRPAWNLLVLDLVLVGAAALALRAATGVRQWRVRNRDAGRGRAVRATVWALIANLAIPVAILALPRLPEANWSLVWSYEPGAVLVLWAAALTLLAVGAAKIGVTVIDARPPRTDPSTG